LVLRRFICGGGSSGSHFSGEKGVTLLGAFRVGMLSALRERWAIASVLSGSFVVVMIVVWFMGLVEMNEFVELIDLIKDACMCSSWKRSYRPTLLC